MHIPIQSIVAKVGATKTTHTHTHIHLRMHVTNAADLDGPQWDQQTLTMALLLLQMIDTFGKYYACVHTTSRLLRKNKKEFYKNKKKKREI